jgi:hypothetical protein
VAPCTLRDVVIGIGIINSSCGAGRTWLVLSFLVPFSRAVKLFFACVKKKKKKLPRPWNSV